MRTLVSAKRRHSKFRICPKNLAGYPGSVSPHWTDGSVAKSNLHDSRELSQSIKDWKCSHSVQSSNVLWIFDDHLIQLSSQLLELRNWNWKIDEKEELILPGWSDALVRNTHRNQTDLKPIEDLNLFQFVMTFITFSREYDNELWTSNYKLIKGLFS